MNTFKSGVRVIQVLLEEYQASTLNRRSMEEVLGKQKRTIYNYLEGITPLSAEQVMILTILLNCPRLLTAWFEDNGCEFWVMPKLTARALYDAAHRARAEVNTFDALAEFIRIYETALEDDYIDSSEQAEIRRHGDLVLMEIGSMVGAAEGISL